MAAGHLGTIWASVALDVAPLGKGAARARRMMYATDATMSKSSGHMTSALMGFAKAGVVAGAMVGAVSVKMAADFDKITREVATLTNTTGAAFQQMQSDILDLSTTTEHSANELAQAYYWVVSAMPDASDAARFDVLDASQKLATAGAADMADTADLVTTTLNAWGLATEDTTHVTDVLFEIVKRGKTTIGELAHNWSKAASAASLMDVPIEDLGAAVATLTRVGIPADRALMAMNRTLIGLNKATPETQEWIKGLGYENAQMMMKSVGLPGFLKALANDFGELSSEEGQNAEALAAMFPNIRELLALLPLTGKNLGDVIADFEAFGDTTDNVKDAFEIMSESLSFQISELMNKIRKPLIELGTKLFPLVEKGITKVADIIEGKNKAFNNIVGIFKGIADVAITLGKVLWDLKVPVYALAAAFVALKVANVLTGAHGIVGGLTALKVAVPGAITGIKSLIANVGANLSLGLSTGAASIGGFAASLGTIAIVALPAIAAIGGFIYAVKSQDEKAEKAWKNLRKMDEEFGQLGRDLKPVIDRFIELRNNTEKTAEEQEEYKNLTGELAQKAPELTKAIDDQGEAILKSDGALNEYVDSWTKYSNIQVKTEGALGDYEEGTKVLGEMNELWSEQGGLMDRVSASLQALDIDPRVIEHALAAGDIEGANEALEALVLNGQALGDIELDEWWSWLQRLGQTTKEDAHIVDQLNDDIKAMDESIKANGVNFSELNTQISKQTSDLIKLRPEILATAKASGEAGEVISEDLLVALRDDLPLMASIGHEAIQNYLAGLAARAGTAGPEFDAALQPMMAAIETGNIVDAWNIAGSMGISQYTDSLLLNMASTLLPAVSLEGASVPQKMAEAIKAGIPLVSQAIQDMVTASITQQVRAAIPEINAETGEIPQSIIDGLTSDDAGIKSGAIAGLEPILTAMGDISEKAGLAGGEGITEKLQGKLAEGDYSATGNVVADKFLKQMAEDVEADSSIIDALNESIEAGTAELEAEIDIIPNNETVDTLKSIIEDGLGKAGAAGGDKAKTEAEEKLKDVKATAKFTGDYTDINKYLNDHVFHGKVLLEQVGAPGSAIHWFDSAYDAGVFIKEHTEEGLNSGGGVKGGVTLGTAGGAGVATLQGEIDALNSSWEELNKTGLVAWAIYDRQKAEWNEMLDAIQSLSPAVDQNVGAWHRMNEQLKTSKAAIQGYEDEIDKLDDAIYNLEKQQKSYQAVIEQHQNKIDKLQNSLFTWKDANGKVQKSIALLQIDLQGVTDKITAHQEALSKLASMKIKGQVAADDESFKLQEKINKLGLDNLKIEEKLRAGKATEAEVERMIANTILKEQLEREKAIHDLQTSVDFDGQIRQQEKLANKEAYREMKLSDILKQIKGHQNALGDESKPGTLLYQEAQITAKVKERETQIRAETKAIELQNTLLKPIVDKIAEMRDTQSEYNRVILDTQAHVQYLEQMVNEMGQAFTTQFDLIKNAAEEAGKSVHQLILEMQAALGGGGAGGSFALGGPVLATGNYTLHAGEFVLSKAMLGAFSQQMSPRLSSPTISLGDQTINVPVYLDGKQIHHATTRIGGKQASAYNRSGGRY